MIANQIQRELNLELLKGSNRVDVLNCQYHFRPDCQL